MHRWLKSLIDFLFFFLSLSSLLFASLLSTEIFKQYLPEEKKWPSGKKINSRERLMFFFLVCFSVYVLWGYSLFFFSRPKAISWIVFLSFFPLSISSIYIIRKWHKNLGDGKENWKIQFIKAWPWIQFWIQLGVLFIILSSEGIKYD